MVYAVVLYTSGGLASQRVKGVAPDESMVNRDPGQPSSDDFVSNLYFGEEFPVHESLKPNISFWIDIYSRYSTKQWVIHDIENMEVIYEVINVDQELPGVDLESRTVTKFLKSKRKHYSSILKHLYKNKGVATSPEEARVAELAGLSAKDYKKYKEMAFDVRSQRGQADRFREGLRQSGKYKEQMAVVFQKYGLPEELTILPHVESSFNYYAYSRAGAAGIWQFTRGTGRQFMKIDYTVDERLDPMLSTFAAARLLKKNYEELGSWPLAITAYNHGLNGMKRAVSRHGKKLEDILAHYRSRVFGFASKNFYAEFLAALEVTRRHKYYFGRVDFLPPVYYDEIVLNKSLPVSMILEISKVDKDVLRIANKALLKPVWDGKRFVPKGFHLRVPEGAGYQTILALNNIPKSSIKSEGRSDAVHVIKRGENLSRIAQKYRVPVDRIKEANNLRSSNIMAGMKLYIPNVARKIRNYGKAEPGYVFVQRGDSLSLIASREKISLTTLAMLNGITMDTVIHPGQKLRVSPHTTSSKPKSSVKQISSIAGESTPSTNDNTSSDMLVVVPMD